MQFPVIQYKKPKSQRGILLPSTCRRFTFMTSKMFNIQNTFSQNLFCILNIYKKSTLIFHQKVLYIEQIMHKSVQHTKQAI